MARIEILVSIPCETVVMTEEPNNEIKDIVWDIVNTQDRDGEIEKAVGLPIRPVSIALLLGTGAFLLFYRAFLRQLTARLGEHSANFLADRLFDLGKKVEELWSNRELSPSYDRNAAANLLSAATRQVRKLPPSHDTETEKATEPAGGSFLLYRIVEIWISHPDRRRKR